MANCIFVAFLEVVDMKKDIYHVCAINWCGHLHFPVILVIAHRLASTHCSCPAAIVNVEYNLPLVMLEKAGG